MATKQTNKTAKRLLDEMVERVTYYYNDVYGDGTKRAHYRNSWHVEEVVGYIKESKEWKFKAYNFQTEKVEDLLLDPETLDKLLTEGVEVVIGQEEGSDVCGLDITRIIRYSSVKELLGSYICREWVTPKTHYVETYMVKNVMYDPEMALYKLTAYSLERKENLTLHYLSDEVYYFLHNTPCIVESVRQKRSKRHHLTNYENTFLLHGDPPRQLSTQGTRWLLSDEGREWIKWEEVKTHTLAQGPEPQPIDVNGKTPKDGRLTPRAVIEEVGLHSEPQHGNIVI